MTAKILDGKLIASQIKEELKSQVDALQEKSVQPSLAVILVGFDAASQVYVNSKKKTCQELGIKSFSYELSKDTTEQELLKLICQLNQDPQISGILVQLPLPEQISQQAVLEAIDPHKDVDCFHPSNIGKLFVDEPVFLPCTPAGIMEILQRSNIGLEGKECVVLGKSNIVGKPLALMLLNAGATVTVCHSKTKDLKSACQRAEILISAVGKPGLVTAEMIKPQAVVIDVGINRLENGKLVGDVDFESVKDIASAITPVPGGVGPMTIAMLMKNVVAAAQN